MGGFSYAVTVLIRRERLDEGCVKIEWLLDLEVIVRVKAYY
jgi:hypothetical protein